MLKLQASRFVECTLLPAKLAESKRKLRLIDYQSNFIKGERIPAFLLHPTKESSTTGQLTGELNPLFKFTSNSVQMDGMEEFSAGQLAWGVAEGVNKIRRGKCVQLRLEGFISAEKQPAKKKRKASVKEEKVKGDEADEQPAPSRSIPDPGFDWSIEGYTMEDLDGVALGQKEGRKARKRTAEGAAKENKKVSS
jgi:hypothetical protein